MKSDNIETLIEEYKKEYTRVNGKVPSIARTTPRSSWIEVNRTFYRTGQLRQMLETLKGRKDNELGAAPVVITPAKPVDKIQRFNCTTSGGNTLSFFYNPDNNLVVVDLIAANEQGGNEILRQYLHEKRMLQHTS